MSLNQKKLLKKQRKEARRQASNVSLEELDYGDDGVEKDRIQSSEDRIPPQAKRALNIVINKPKNLSPRVSKAFDNGEWDEAFSLLFAMRYMGQVPKLGTLQRWIANLGDNTVLDPTALGLLYAILRVAEGLGVDLASTKKRIPMSSSETPLDSTQHQIHDISKNKLKQSSKQPTIESFSMMNPHGRLVVTKEWAPIPLLPDSRSSCYHCNEEEADLFRNIFSVLSVIKGPDRTPPNRHDLSIYECIPNAMGFHLNNSPCRKLSLESNKFNVPFVPGAFVLTDLLSKQECDKVIKAAETIGFVPDEPVMRQTALVASTSAGLDDRAANFTWLADEALMESIMFRCKHLFPQVLSDGSEFVGMNARWRLYRYYPGSIYRPHVDGAWPQSGKVLNSQGSGVGNHQYEYDISQGKVRSRLTFLIYLNEGFEGGHTTYFTPNEEKEGEVLAHKLSPRVGMAVLFPHGDGAGSLVHEGSNLESGVKYVVRSDALYTVPTSTTEVEVRSNEFSEGLKTNKKLKRR